jgi:hypothetical protein
MLLEFARAAGERVYAWDAKIAVAVSAVELGTIFADPSAVRCVALRWCTVGAHTEGGVVWG